MVFREAFKGAEFDIYSDTKAWQKQQSIHINPLDLSLDISVCCHQKKIASKHLQELFWEAIEHQNCAVVLWYTVLDARSEPIHFF